MLMPSRRLPPRRDEALRRACLAAALILVVGLSPAAGEQLLDRVVARVGTRVITQTDLDAARALGLIEERPSGDPGRSAVQQMIDRQLLLMEVARFPPPEPDSFAIEAHARLLEQRAGGSLPMLMQSTGLDERRIRELARDNLRIQAYIDQRFGMSVQVSDEEVRQYYEANRSSFTRDGVLVPFEQAEIEARQRAAAERRDAIIGQWLREARARAKVVEVQQR